MARRPRIHFNGAIYHALARGVDRRDVFLNDEDRFEFLEGMSRMKTEGGAKFHAYCLMGNHFHFAIQVSSQPLSQLMHGLLTKYVSNFNRRHGRTGHLFEGRFKSYLCLDESYLARLIPYIHMNPVRAGFVAVPGLWRWSSYDGKSAIEDLTEFDPWPKDGTRQIPLIRNETPSLPELDGLGASVASRTATTIEAMRSRSFARCLVRARREFVLEGLKAGYKQAELARWLSSTASAVSRFARKSEKVGSLTP